MFSIELIGRTTNEVHEDIRKFAINKDIAGLIYSNLKTISPTAH